MLFVLICQFSYAWVTEHGIFNVVFKHICFLERSCGFVIKELIHVRWHANAVGEEFGFLLPVQRPTDQLSWDQNWKRRNKQRKVNQFHRCRRQHFLCIVRNERRKASSNKILATANSFCWSEISWSFNGHSPGWPGVAASPHSVLCPVNAVYLELYYR